MYNYISEAEVQQRIVNDKIVQDGILNALDVEGHAEFIREDAYINGITADFSLVVDDKIRAIIECKAGNINVTDYVRGIGQLFQYEYFAENAIPHKALEYNKKFDTVYFFPATVLKNNVFNIAKFKYPTSTMILELNDNNNAVRKISQKELTELKNAEDDNLVTISQYYFRDNRIFEYYILLKYLLFRMQMGYTSCNRVEVTENFLIKLETINNGNWRNAFITLANLGLIDDKNMPSEAGKKLAIMSYEKFAVSMYHSYLEPYFSEVMRCFEESQTLKASNQEIAAKIRRHYRDRDVLYMTQSDGRYISSWMNIFRDDYGMIEFKPRSNDRNLVYIPKEVSELAFENNIRKNSVAYKYLDRYYELIKGGQF